MPVSRGVRGVTGEGRSGGPIGQAGPKSHTDKWLAPPRLQYSGMNDFLCGVLRPTHRIVSAVVLEEVSDDLDWDNITDILGTPVHALPIRDSHAVVVLVEPGSTPMQGSATDFDVSAREQPTLAGGVPIA